MSSSNPFNPYEVPSIAERDNDYTGLDLAKLGQDEDVYDDVSEPANTISRPSIQPVVLKEPVKKKIGKLSFNMHNPLRSCQFEHLRESMEMYSSFLSYPGPSALPSTHSYSH